MLSFHTANYCKQDRDINSDKQHRIKSISSSNLVSISTSKALFPIISSPKLHYFWRSLIAWFNVGYYHTTVTTDKQNLPRKTCLVGSCWWYSKHVPINFINILLPLPVNCPCTIIFWLIFRYQSFSLQNTLSLNCMLLECKQLQTREHKLSDQEWT